MTLNKFSKTVLLSLAFSGCLNAFALDSDRKQPIQIEADQASLDQKNQVTTFSGNVIIKQGTLNFRAQNVRLSQDKNGNQSVTASGSPVYFSQQLENKGKVEGQGNKVEYSSATNVVKLLGNAKVQRGGDVARGQSITYNTKTEVYSVLGGKSANGKSSSRVSIIIQPNSK